MSKLIKYLYLTFAVVSLSFITERKSISVKLINYDAVTRLLSIELYNQSSEDLLMYKPCVEIGDEFGVTNFYIQNNGKIFKQHFPDSNGELGFVKISKIDLDTNNAILIPSGEKVNFKIKIDLEVEFNKKSYLQLILKLGTIRFEHKQSSPYKHIKIFNEKIESNKLLVTPR